MTVRYLVKQKKRRNEIVYQDKKGRSPQREQQSKRLKLKGKQ